MRKARFGIARLLILNARAPSHPKPSTHHHQRSRGPCSIALPPVRHMSACSLVHDADVVWYIHNYIHTYVHTYNHTYSSRVIAARRAAAHVAVPDHRRLRASCLSSAIPQTTKTDWRLAFDPRAQMDSVTAAFAMQQKCLSNRGRAACCIRRFSVEERTCR